MRFEPEIFLSHGLQYHVKDHLNQKLKLMVEAWDYILYFIRFGNAPFFPELLVSILTFTMNLLPIY